MHFFFVIGVENLQNLQFICGPQKKKTQMVRALIPIWEEYHQRKAPVTHPSIHLSICLSIVLSFFLSNVVANMCGVGVCKWYPVYLSSCRGDLYLSATVLTARVLVQEQHVTSRSKMAPH